MKYYLTSGQTLRLTSHSKTISTGMHCTIHSAVSQRKVCRLPQCRHDYPSLVSRFGRKALGFAAAHKFSFSDTVKHSPGQFPSSQRNTFPFSLPMFASSHPSHPAPCDLICQPWPVCRKHPFLRPTPHAYSGNSCRIVWTVSQEALLLLSTSLRTPAKDPAHLLSKTDKLRGLELKFRNSKWGTLDTILLT